MSSLTKAGPATIDARNEFWLEADADATLFVGGAFHPHRCLYGPATEEEEEEEDGGYERAGAA